jgi:hypothetical protein
VTNPSMIGPLGLGWWSQRAEACAVPAVCAASPLNHTLVRFGRQVNSRDLKRCVAV